LEKAFAKFVGGYMNLEGGCPRWAVTYLSGGITTHDEITDSFSIQNAVSNNLLMTMNYEILFVVKLFL